MTPLPLGILALAGVTGGGAAYELLETTTLNSGASSITFSGLSAYSDFKHLQIRGTQRLTGPSTLWSGYAILNGVSTSGNYTSHFLGGNGSSVYTGQSTHTDKMQMTEIPGADNTSGIFNSFVMDIFDFADSSKNTTIRNLGGVNYANPSTGGRITLNSGLYLSTNSITSVTFDAFAGTQTFIAGCRLSIYGGK